tara:strand:- start:2843 stop:5050 length:2208 start_codon:yes stop_codon:yes gene_type:complete
MTHSTDPYNLDAVEQFPATSDLSDKRKTYSNRQITADRRRESQRWWIKLFVQPMLILVAAGMAIAGLGIAQRSGWISTVGSGGGATMVSETAVDYICPMMCTPPQKEPGRCPVCAMELVPATTSGGGDSLAVHLDPAARRIANIKTASVRSVPTSRTIKAIGKLTYDEGTMRTIAAWVPGRLEKMYADYNGVVVKEGDHLALVYSPELYTGQVELLLAIKTQNASKTLGNNRSFLTDGSMYKSARQRLIESGMTNEQIQEVEESGEANSRIHLCAPAGGTVINKMAVEGEYVKEGQPIYQLADLSTIWLKMELYPKDAAVIRYAQQVDISVQSLPGRLFSGRVAFIDPKVNEATRTVGVRVVMENPNGLLKIGDYANASITTGGAAEYIADAKFYDVGLAGKWISPRHPQIIKNEPGECPISGLKLVPAEEYGYVASPLETENVLTVPRNAVLMAGRKSVIYVETEPGRFEIRKITLGHLTGEEIVVLDGISEGEKVATSGNFLIDSQMQLAGNPSLIDPTRAIPKTDDLMTPEIMLALEELSEEDQKLAKEQIFCPVTEMPLGSMGVPLKVTTNEQNMLICCEGCRERVQNEPDKYLAKIDQLKKKSKNKEAEEFEMDLPSFEGMELVQPEMNLPPMGEMSMTPQMKKLEPGRKVETEEEAVQKAIAKLSPSDQKLARQQEICPVATMELGSMGVPIKVDVKGQPVFICCEACRKSLLETPDKYLGKLPAKVVK